LKSKKKHPAVFRQGSNKQGEFQFLGHLEAIRRKTILKISNKAIQKIYDREKQLFV